MMAEGTENPGPLGSFWQKVSGKSKMVKFMPNVTRPEDENAIAKADKEADSSSGLTQKQRRRAQVRKAQIEHRQRKENYVKHLEQDIINLREMIATATTQTVLFRHENEAMRTTLSKSHIPISLSSAVVPLAQPVINLPDAQGLSYSGSEYQQGSEGLGAGGLSLSPEHEQLWTMLSAPNDGSSHRGSLVSIGFDEVLDASCLQISTILTPAFDFGNADVTMAEADPFNLGTGSVGDGTAFDPFNAIPSPNHLEGEDALQKELPAISVNAERVVPTTEADLETVAVNFILALEHGCVTHFSPLSSTFDPEGKPSGHELMASTFLYSAAPSTIFSDPKFVDGPHPPHAHVHFQLHPEARQQSHAHTHLHLNHHHHLSSSQAEAGAPSHVNAGARTEPQVRYVDGADTGHEETALQWPAPALTLQSLYALSTSLPKSDWEITPVQAWFKLSAYLTSLDPKPSLAYPNHTSIDSSPSEIFPESLLRDRDLMERLKREIAALVDCFQFGAVLDEERFWEVVKRELGRGEGRGV